MVPVDAAGLSEHMAFASPRDHVAWGGNAYNLAEGPRGLPRGYIVLLLDVLSRCSRRPQNHSENQ